MAEPLISARSIVRRFGEMPVLHSLDIDLQPGEFCAITGKSGAGKSTLLGILGTLDMKYEGTLTIRGTDVRKCSSGELSKLRRESIGFIFQDFHLLPNLPAIDNILLPAVSAAPQPGEEGAGVMEPWTSERPDPSRSSPGRKAACGNRQGTGQPAGYPTGRRAHRQSRREERERSLRPP